MTVASVDIGWKEGSSRGAVALADAQGDISLLGMRLSDEAIMEHLHRNSASVRYVLLDIPIRGANVAFRPIDRALQRQGIPILPSTNAGGRGERLEQRIKQVLDPGALVWEIYPYQVCKVLFYLQYRGALSRLRDAQINNLLGPDFRTSWPPKYKRERDRVRRRQNLRQLYDLLTSEALGLSFSNPLPEPQAKPEQHVTDAYDAALGAVLGWLALQGSPYVCHAGDPQGGSLLVLADGWLQGQFARDVITWPTGVG